MIIIIVGIGKLGRYLAHELVEDGYEVTIIDKKIDKHNSTINNEDLNYINGNGLDSNILLEAGIDSSDLLISVMGKDEKNVMCCLLAKKLGVKHTIARIRTPEYINSLGLIKDDIGLSMMINPDLLTARHIADILSIPNALDTATFFKGRLQLISLKVKKDTKLVNVSVRDFSKEHSKNIIICSIERNGKTIIPSGNIIIKEHDVLNITGKRKDIQKLLTYTGYLTDKTKQVMIIGGSSTGVYLAKILSEMNIKNKIIDVDEERCKELTELLPDTMIINGDATNENILYEEDIEKMDAFVTLKSIDEENIILSMFAKLNNVKKVITKVTHINLGGTIELSNVDSVVTPHKIVTNQIVTYIRAMQNSESSNCESIYKFNDKNFEIIEFSVKNNFKALNIPIKDINLKKNIIIIAILRGKNIIFPNGKDVIKEKDELIVIHENKLIKEINDIVENKHEK